MTLLFQQIGQIYARLTTYSVDRSGSSRFLMSTWHNLFIAHVAGWKPCIVRLILQAAHVSWVGSVLYRSCTAYRNGRLDRICMIYL